MKLAEMSTHNTSLLALANCQMPLLRQPCCAKVLARFRTIFPCGVVVIRRSPSRLSPNIKLAVELLRASRRLLALTGAGISTPSGIPDFRSERSGLWKRADPLEVASIWGFHDHPDRFYEWLRPVLVRTTTAQPNGAHRVLARMEAAGRLAGVVTQNIDSLHQAAGSRYVCELHGHLRTATCLGCGEQVDGSAVVQAVLAGLPAPRCSECGELLKPDFVLFGEPLPYDTLSRAQERALACDVMLIAGTSLEVMPAADLPLLARRRGARLVLVNLSPTPLDAQMDVIIRADVVSALEALEECLGD
jgi:NAD-dependent deacetylase